VRLVASRFMICVGNSQVSAHSFDAELVAIGDAFATMDDPPHGVRVLLCFYCALLWPMLFTSRVNPMQE